MADIFTLQGREKDFIAACEKFIKVNIKYLLVKAVASHKANAFRNKKWAENVLCLSFRFFGMKNDFV